MDTQVTAAELSDKVKKEIDHWIAKYPADQKQSAVMQALMIVQESAEDKCLNPSRIAAVAEYLEMSEIAVTEVATFYSMYEHAPCGQHKISVCTNVSCKLRGADDIVKHLKKRLGIGFGETTKDGCISLREVECLGACIGAPMFQLDKAYHEHLTPEKVDTILDKLEEKA